MSIDQMVVWGGDFGREYTDRNARGLEYWDARYVELFGTSRSDMNRAFLGEMDIENMRILEVGCNVGEQLLFLQRMGAKHLYGIELQSYAVEQAKGVTQGINIIQGQGDDIPFRDEYFDLVFTSGVLIHIPPGKLSAVMNEIVRCSKTYIWGMEYYSDSLQTVKYGENGAELCWKADYAGIYLSTHKNLHEVRRENYAYLTTGNVDQMFLLSK